MANGKDVYEDNTAGGAPQRDTGSPATTYEPGEKPFKDKGGKNHGYTHVPGAGENPGKIEHE